MDQKSKAFYVAHIEEKFAYFYTENLDFSLILVADTARGLVELSRIWQEKEREGYSLRNYDKIELAKIGVRLTNLRPLNESELDTLL